ncbi:molybdate ABC transporter substrate-binding protein [Evansella halocellulosilytica]|uniref:molybdate ABC transporter substrate-binding protein n=1 Tax=Evansella halocellulosilytica TaxID=2011013 RepID=UPI000BB8E50B|nr:molybdate ABC transporter substrate-binding protein [Evansella halocellulosilytica]
MKKTVYFLVFSLFFIGGCSSATEQSDTLYVAAASDMYHALTEVGHAFTEKTDVEIEFTYGSTGQLTQQIQEGAPFDLFLAAHDSYIDQLIDREAVYEDSKAYYSRGTIVFMHTPKVNIDDQGEFLLNDDVTTVTIANPEHAPYGKAAKEALESLEIWNEVEPKIVYAENIRQAYQYVESGNADVGIIALALMNETDLYFEKIDGQLHEPIRQALAIPRQTNNKELAEQFSDFILSEEGQGILKSYGFDNQ